MKAEQAHATTKGQGHYRVPKRTRHARQWEEHHSNLSLIKAIPSKASLAVSLYYGPVLPLLCQKLAHL